MNIVIYLVCSAVIAATAFIGGKYIGTRQAGASAPKENKEIKIAVVNHDTGVSKKGKEISYFQALIKPLSEDYGDTIETVLDDSSAQIGMKNGKYDAVITFTSNFSKHIDSFNRSIPEKAQVYYSISSKLGKEKKTQTTEKVLGLTQDINKRLSRMFVTGAMNELTTVQNQAKSLMNNDQKDLNQILEIKAFDFIKTIQIDPLKELDINTKQLDLSKDFEQNIKIMKELDNLYKKYLAVSKENHKALAVVLSDQLGTLQESYKTILDSYKENSKQGGRVDQAANGKMESKTNYIENENTFLNDLSSFFNQNSDIAKALSASQKEALVLREYPILLNVQNKSCKALKSELSDRIKEINDSSDSNEKLKKEKEKLEEEKKKISEENTYLSNYQKIYEDFTKKNEEGWKQYLTDNNITLPTLPESSKDSKPDEEEPEEKLSLETIMEKVDTDIKNQMNEEMKDYDFALSAVPAVFKPGEDNFDAYLEVLSKKDTPINEKIYQRTKKFLSQSDLNTVINGLESSESKISEKAQKVEEYQKGPRISQMVFDVKTLIDAAGEAAKKEHKEDFKDIKQTNNQMTLFDPTKEVTDHQGELDEKSSAFGLVNTDIQTKMDQWYGQVGEQASKNFGLYEKNVAAIEKSIAKTQKTADHTTKAKVENMKKQKETHSKKNQEDLLHFTKILPSLRIGKAQNVNLFDFMANPLNTKKETEVKAQEEKEVKTQYNDFYKIMSAAVLILILFGGGMAVVKFRDKN